MKTTLVTRKKIANHREQTDHSERESSLRPQNKARTNS